MTLLLDAKGLSKRYGAVRALAGADLAVAAGEIHALLGANGCGKSTLCKIIAGAVRADSGELRFQDQERHFRSPREAEKAGVALFYQELSLIPRMSVAQNIFLGREPRNALGFVDGARLRRDSQALIDEFSGVADARLKPDAIIADLPPDLRQIVEILKNFAQSPRLMIMDEATAALDGRQAKRFFEILAAKKAQGVSTVMISHRLDEVFAVADRVTVMRDGASILRAPIAAVTREELVQAMVGGHVAASAPRPAATRSAAARISVDNVCGPGLADISCSLAPGEIVGLGGLQGQGQSALLRGLFGAQPFTTGHVALDGARLALRSPRAAMKHGIAYISGDRGRDAGFSGRSIFENLAAALVSRGAAIVRPSRLKPALQEAAASLKTKFSDMEAPIDTLSGGNQQKIFIARWLLTAPRLLLLDDPTKGIDLSAKADLFALMREQAARGATILFYSSEDAELLENCDRVLVFNRGRIGAELDRNQLSAAALTRAAFGEAAGEAA